MQIFKPLLHIGLLFCRDQLVVCLLGKDNDFRFPASFYDDRCDFRLFHNIPEIDSGFCGTYGLEHGYLSINQSINQSKIYSQMEWLSIWLIRLPSPSGEGLGVRAHLMPGTQKFLGMVRKFRISSVDLSYVRKKKFGLLSESQLVID